MAVNNPSDRTEHDSWDIVSSVGFTALGVAAARALQNRRAQPLAVDPFAEAFVTAAGHPETQALLENAPEEAQWDEQTALWTDFFGARTRYFDEYFAGAGTPQVVILAAGLDSRAYRLPWQTGSVLFEVDQPEVLRFKADVIGKLGAQPLVDRREVAFDLRDEWAAALTAAGFDPEKPTAWLAEGLLIYLPGPAQDALFAQMHALSAPGSRMGVENGFRPGDVERVREAAAKGVVLRSGGSDFDPTTLWYDDPRADPQQWLAERGWTVAPVGRAQVAASYGRPFPEQFAALWSSTGYFTAER
ncbi:methyltransferase [Segniliparus rotundus DSM 44985]|uniref:S-adenosyl-L-methionine-dependent methyltransferase n=1 Tax=Segniliparus rotundus (strain ATCC BAA-972 / CDC 1076 / CIP 108378 / DSM 44985 / JCM 13578) TaxID=640132 RepID=D6ZCQ0_SEGRD|nr:class I SAM-dependent methyltransferase [Segniliparus rotundus]ADG97092.1 methyltransferase [Segniliparus rotundus DSM 44985]